MFNMVAQITDPAQSTNYYRISYAIFSGRLQYSFKGENNEVEFSVQRRYESIWTETDDKLLNPEDDADDFLFGSGNNKFNLFTDELINGKSFKFSVRSNSYNIEYLRYNKELNTDKGEFSALEIKLHALSPEAYWYMKSLQQSDYSGDLDILTEPVPIYSNIKNGVGIFAGMSAYRYIVPIFGEYPKPGIKYTDIVTISN
jgi:hypothetical protein